MRFGARLLASVLILTMYLPVAVVHADSDTLKITGLSGNEITGVADSFQVEVDSGSSPDPAYTGTVQFLSSDQTVSLADYVFTGPDAGVHTFRVTFGTTGLQSVTATDSIDPLITDTANT